MTAQSWVETTLPPGYRALSGYRAVSVWAMWGGGADDDEDLGWECGGAIRFGFRREADRNRAAWRHWTAAVLRGRDVEWEDNGEDGTNSWVGNVRLERYPAVHGVCNCVSVYACDDVRGAHEKVRDDDEAMARFAFILAGLQGPP